MLRGVVLASVLFLTSPVISQEVEVQSQEVVEENNIEKIINDAIDGKLDQEALKEALESITQEEIDKVLSKFIEDEKERSKVNGIVYAIIIALVDLVVLSIFLSKISKEGKTAHINNKTFNKVSSEMKNQSIEVRDFVKDAKESLEAMKKQIDKVDGKYDLAIDLINKLLAMSDKSFKSVMGILEVAYNQEEENNEEESQQEENTL